VTPKEAENIFQNLNHDRNRRFDARRADSIAYAMMEGDVDETETVVFCVWEEKTILVDGQHRMWSVTQLDEDWEFTVNYKKVDTFEEVCATYAGQDLGSSRSTSECARSMYLDDKIGVSKRVFNIGLSAAKLINVGFRSGKTNEMNRIIKCNRRTNETALDYKKELRMFDELQKKGVKDVKDKFMNAPTIAVALITLRHQPNKATEFWGEMLKDDGLKQGDPRKALLVFVGEVKEKDVTLRGHERALHVAMAWNAFYSCRNMRRIKRKENLITPVGLAISGTPWDGDKLEP
jgi:hypothetical protein